MTQQVIPIQALAAQTFAAVLGTQNCKITLKWMSTGLYASVSMNGQQIIAGKFCNDRVNLIRQAYLGFTGWLYFVDTTNQGVDPFYQGLGSRFLLIYESP